MSSRPTTIAEAVNARAGDDRPALLFEGGVWTWAEVHAEAARRADRFTALVSDGTGSFHAGVLLDNVPDYVFLLFGAALAGATIVGINPTRRGAELSRDITHTDCQMIFTNDEYCGLLQGIDLGAAAGRIVDVDEPAPPTRPIRPTTATRPAPPAAPTPQNASTRQTPDAPYLLIFTAGSTGAPKAVRMSQGRAAMTAGQTARAFGPDDVLYCSMPLFHGNALVANLFPALIAGSSVVLRRRFSASAFLPDIRRHGCTYFNYVGRTLSYILAVPETPQDSDNSLRWALGSEAAPRDIAEFTRRFGCPVIEGYGSSENAVVIQPGPDTPPGALGRPRSGMDVTVVDPATGDECAVARIDPDGHLLNPAEAIGEIVGRNTSGLFEGYYNNPDAEALRTRSGWYWTGDLGYRDADGIFYFAGRSADWLRVDGENFSAGAVEKILQRFDGYTGVAVYGVPDPVTGDQVMVAVESPEPAAFDPAGFQEFLSAQSDLGTKWAPRFIRVTTSLPVTGTGKVDKVTLRAAGWDTADPTWWRTGRDLDYRLLTTSDRSELRTRFAESGRSHLLHAER